MANDYIDFVGEIGAPTDNVTECRAAFDAADAEAARRKIRRIVMPNKTFVVAGTRAQIIKPTYATKWVPSGSNRPTIKVAPGALSNQELTIWAQNVPGYEIRIIIDGNAVNQAGFPNLFDDSAPGDTLTGYRCNGFRSQLAAAGQHGIADVRIINTRSITAAGDGSTFAFQSLSGQGGENWLDFETTDGSIGNEGAVFQGKTQNGGDAWIIRRLRSKRMWRGFGCYGGHNGYVYDLVVEDLTGPYASNAPISGGVRKIRGNAMNIESGPQGTGRIQIFDPHSTNADQFLVIRGNNKKADGTYTPGTGIQRVDLNGGISDGDGDCLVINIDASAVKTAINVADAFFDQPTGKVINILSAAASADNLDFVRSKYRLLGGHSLGTTNRWGAGLTAGTAAVNTAPVLSAISPADGTTVPVGTTVRVACKATDNADTPASGLTAAGQVYLPAVTATSATVASSPVNATATITATAHRATNGGQVRLAGFTPAALNGTRTVTSVANANTLTVTVPPGTGNATVQGTVEPLGSAITMTTNDAEDGFEGDWLTPSTTGQVRRIEVTVTDSGALSSTIATTVTATNNPPLVAVVPFLLGLVSPAASQQLAAIIIDPNVGDTIASTDWTVKDSAGTTRASGTLAAQTPAVNTTLTAAIADVATLTGETTDTVALATTVGASSSGGHIAIAHGTTSLVVIRYAGIAGVTLTGCKLIAGTGPLGIGDTVKSATHTATFDASAFTGTYTAQATATDNHGAPGASSPVTFSIDTPPPVTWRFPAASPKQTIGGIVTLLVEAPDDAGVATVTGQVFILDTGTPVPIGALALTSSGVLALANFNTATLTDDADHTLRATVVDAHGLITNADVIVHVHQATADTTPPTITAVMFADGSTLVVPAELSAAISDPAGLARQFARIYLPGGATLDLPMEPQP